MGSGEVWMVSMTHLPRCIAPGCTIGIVSPAGPVPRESVERGVAAIEARGYRAVLGESVFATTDECDYLAGTDAQRAADLNGMIARVDVDAILCTRGGYGCARLLGHLDTRPLLRHPKPFIGYSDITALHLALERHHGMATFHGPMAAKLPHLGDTMAAVFWRMLEDPSPAGTLPVDTAGLTTLVPGEATGRLGGGCLCLLAHACGTDCAPDFARRIVLIEDVGEPVYRVDRDMAQLDRARLLHSAAGFVVGNVTGWKEKEGVDSHNDIHRVWERYLLPLGKPTILGYPFGHVAQPLTLPLGVLARLDADARTLTILEPATRPR